MDRMYWPLVPGPRPNGTSYVPRRLLLVALAGTLSLACAQTDVTGPEQPAISESSVNIAPGFLRCRPLAAASASKYVSPGVRDTLKIGPHKLIFQPGSLSQKTLITASVSADSSRSVRFSPEGLQFKNGYSPTLVLSMNGCSALSSTLKVVYADDNLTTVKETKSSVVNLPSATVSAPISHFSRYAVHH